MVAERLIVTFYDVQYPVDFDFVYNLRCVELKQMVMAATFSGNLWVELLSGHEIILYSLFAISIPVGSSNAAGVKGLFLSFCHSTGHMARADIR